MLAEIILRHDIGAAAIRVRRGRLLIGQVKDKQLEYDRDDDNRVISQPEETHWQQNEERGLRTIASRSKCVQAEYRHPRHYREFFLLLFRCRQRLAKDDI